MKKRIELFARNFLRKFWLFVVCFIGILIRQLCESATLKEALLQAVTPLVLGSILGITYGVIGAKQGKIIY